MDQIVILQLYLEHADIKSFYDKINKIQNQKSNNCPKILIFDNYTNLKNCSILNDTNGIKCEKKIYSNFDISNFKSLKEKQGNLSLKEYMDDDMST